MKLLVDTNLSFKLLQSFRIHFKGSIHVSDVLDFRSPDHLIWNYAKAHDYIILTKDNDFDERSQLDGCPPKIIHLIVGNKATSYIAELIINRKLDILSFGDSDTENCILKIS